MSRWLFMCALGFTLCAYGADYCLVSDGAAESAIVLARDAGPVEKHAAAELAAYLSKVSGVKIKVQTARSPRLYNIFIGTVGSRHIPLSNAMKASLPNIARHGFMLAADDHGLRIIGREPIGALYGAYHVLKQHAGLRWFAPGAQFEHCPRTPTVTVPGQLTVSNPSFRFRYLGFVCANWNSKIVDSWDWMVRNGMTVRAGKRLYNMFRDELEKRGAETYHGGHSFAYLLRDKLFDAHPEYFPLRDGKRTKQKAEGERAARRQPCTTNPEVAATMARSLSAYLSSPPRGGSYLIGNNDATHWCQCGECLASDPTAEARKRFVSTRYYRFVNSVVERVAPSQPDAELWAWAYQNYQFPPTGVTPDKRLAISVCVHGRCYRHPMADESCLANAKFRDMLAGWTKFGNPVV